MPDPIHIVTGHALDSGTFCIAMSGMLDAGDPLTMLLIFEEGLDQPWGRVDVRRSVVSVSGGCYWPDEPECFTALSDEGDVWFLRDEGVPLEKIFGAGVHSDDATGRGPMTRLYSGREEHYAIGAGGQIYVRREAGSWTDVSPGMPYLGADDSRLFLNAIDRISGDEFIAAGTLFVDGKVDEAALDAAMEAGDFDLYAELSVDGGGGQIGVLLVASPKGWTQIDLPSNGRVLDLCREHESRSHAIALDEGLLFRLSEAQELTELSNGETTESFMTLSPGQLGVIAGAETDIFTLAPDGLLQSPAIPNEGFTSIKRVQQSGGALWVFDDQAVFRLTRTTWTKFVVPQAILDAPAGPA